jgi:hypothetical protein
MSGITKLIFANKTKKELRFCKVMAVALLLHGSKNLAPNKGKLQQLK